MTATIILFTAAITMFGTWASHTMYDLYLTFEYDVDIVDGLSVVIDVLTDMLTKALCIASLPALVVLVNLAATGRL